MRTIRKKRTAPWQELLPPVTDEELLLKAEKQQKNTGGLSFQERPRRYFYSEELFIHTCGYEHGSQTHM